MSETSQNEYNKRLNERLEEIARPVNQRPCWQIVLSALQQSPGERTICVNGITFGWCDGKLCQVLKYWNGENGPMFISDGTIREPDEVSWNISDISLNNFITRCDKIPQEEIVNIAFSTSMAKINQEKQDARNKG